MLSLQMRINIVIVIIVLIPMIPVIIWLISVFIRNRTTKRRYKDIVEVSEVRLEQCNIIEFGIEFVYFVPVYKFIYNNIEYEVQSQFIRTNLFYEINDKVKIRLRINPDDPYDVKEVHRFILRRKGEATKDNLIVFGYFVIAFIIAYLIALKLV